MDLCFLLRGRGGLTLILAGPTAYMTASRGYSVLVAPAMEQSCLNLQSTPSPLAHTRSDYEPRGITA